MPEVLTVDAAGFRFIKGVFQYSGGVASEAGHEIRRARFIRPVPLADGFAAIEKHLKSLDRPLSAFCACELRSPAPFTEAEFAAFNRLYVGTLERWGVLLDGVNPVARTNICPELDKPAGPSFYAFSYTVPSQGRARGSFVAAGSGEAPEGKGSYRDHAIRLGDHSPEGLREKARWVLGEMERRMSALGFDWSHATGTHLYTVFDVHPFLQDEIVGRGATPAGLTWHFARPPVRDLDFEMDVRGVPHELVLG
ncbi:MAG: hypothetical protein KIT81_08525 [Alphaproteobacteria bacterium]|nr:hypothetical protein [Alphaproteobacteria bacterium]